MYRFLKWLVWIAGICFVFVIIAIVAVQIFLSSDEVIRIAEREGRNILGRKVSIERLELGLFKIEASGIVIEGQTEKEEGKSKKPFIRFDEVEILLNPSTLIYKRISILQLTINNTSARVRRDANGRFNFQDIIDNLNRGARNTASVHGGKSFSFINTAEAAENVLQNSEPGFSLIIHELDLYDVNTELIFDAGKIAQPFDGSCSFAHIEVDKIIPGKPLDLFIDGKCRRADGQRLVELRGASRIDLKVPSYRASFEMPLFDSSFMPAVAPNILGYRFREGVFAGNLKLGYFTDKPLTWDIDLKGQNIRADFQTTPRAKLRKLALPELKLKTKGSFNLRDGSARVETLFVETPFLGAKLMKPSSWNVSARDEVYIEAKISDMRQAGDWFSQAAGIRLRGLQERATAQVLVSMKRDRRISHDFDYVEVDSRFDPVDLTRFEEFIPPAEHISKIKGFVGGKARVVFVSGKQLKWDAALETRGFGATVKTTKKKPWKAVELGMIVLHSRGNFEMKDESAHVERLDIELPFAAAKLQKPAKWNINGNDEASFSLDVRNFSSANVFLERLGLATFGDVPRDAKLRLDAAVSRNRSNPSAFEIDAKTHFTSLPITPLVDLIPAQQRVRDVTGLVSGELQVSLNLDGVIRWNVDIAGKKLAAETRMTSNDSRRRVSLASAVVKSSGIYLASKGSAEIHTLDFKLPFARAYLNRQALWNQKERDEFSLILDVTDLSTAEVWLGKLMDDPVKPSPKSGKMKILLSGARNRNRGHGFSYKGSASFDFVRISPWVKFVSLPPAFRKPVGDISGKMEFSYIPGGKITWSLGITSEGLEGKFLALSSHDWRSLRTGEFRLKTTGFHDLRNQSGRLHNLNLSMPFGNLRASMPADWSMNGIETGRFKWSVSNLEGAAQFAASIWGRNGVGIFGGGFSQWLDGIFEIQKEYPLFSRELVGHRESCITGARRLPESEVGGKFFRARG